METNEGAKINTVINETGKLNAFGMDISIADIVGEKIVDKWFAQITPDDMALIFKAVEDEVFSHNYNDEKFFKTQEKVKSNWGSDKYEDTPIWKTTQKAFAKKYNEVVLSKVDEIIASEAYQKKAQEIAEEIVNYATEGYKADMKKRVYERMVSNTTDYDWRVNGYNLRDFVYQVVQEMAPITQH